MNPGITRWKIVPSYSGTPCLLAPLTGFFQSLVPLARPIKFSTPIGALSGKRVHIILPTLVLIIAVGFVAVAAAGLAALVVLAAVPGLAAPWVGELDCARGAETATSSKKMIANPLRMNAPCFS